MLSTALGAVVGAIVGAVVGAMVGAVVSAVLGVAGAHAERCASWQSRCLAAARVAAYHVIGL